MKPRIKLSTLSRAFICSGMGVTGSGWTMRDAWECWAEILEIKNARKTR